MKKDMVTGKGLPKKISFETSMVTDKSQYKYVIPKFQLLN
jgi:hypothetical protein